MFTKKETTRSIIQIQWTSANYFLPMINLHRFWTILILHSIILYSYISVCMYLRERDDIMKHEISGPHTIIVVLNIVPTCSHKQYS